MKKPPYIYILLRERRIPNVLFLFLPGRISYLFAHPSISSLSKHLSSNLFDIQTVF